MATASKINGSFIYDKVFKLLDYCGEIKNSEDVVGYRYSDKFSPNNIRRLLISPDGVIAIYHTPIQGGVKQQKVVLNPVEVQIAENQPDYKPIMNILSTNRICSSIEEVVFLVNSRNSNISLSSNEFAFGNLVKSYTGKSGSSLQETVANRYKRLRVFTIAYMNLDEFLANAKSCNSTQRYEFWSDMPFMDNAQKQYVHKDDWWKSWGSAAKTYPMDAIGGSLHNHFSKIKVEKEALEKKKAVDDSKAERNKGLISEVETRYKRYSSLAKIANRLNKLVAECGVNGLSDVNYRPYEVVELYKCSVIDNYPKLTEATSESEALKKNNEVLRLELSKLVFHLSSVFLLSFYSVVENSPITAKVLYRVCDENTIIVPSDMTTTNNLILLGIGVNFDGTSIPESVVNTCWLYCSCFLDRTSEKFDSKVVTREYWKGALK